MRRREFITLLGGTAVAWPLAARAQQAARVPVMVSRGRSQDEARGDTAAFLQGLNEFGYVDSTLLLRVTRSEIRFTKPSIWFLNHLRAVSHERRTA